MLKTLRSRLEKLEQSRAARGIEIVRVHPGGGATLTVIRSGRIASRRELTPEEAARLAVGAITIERSYGLPTSDDLPPTRAPG